MGKNIYLKMIYIGHQNLQPKNKITLTLLIMSQKPLVVVSGVTGKVPYVGWLFKGARSLNS